MRIRFFVSTFAILMLLSACSSTPPAVSQVLVSSGVANDSFKVGETPILSALAKDSGGNTLSGKTFVWASSNPNIATVDAAGKLTPKQVGSIKISAIVDGIKGEKTITIYGLDVIGGMGKFNDVPANAYLNLAVRLVLPGGIATPAGTLSITGPTGFNTNQPFAYAYTADVQNGLLSTNTVTPVSGTYQASTTAGGQTYQTSFSVDTSNLLPYPTGIQTTAKSVSSVSASWTAVTGAVSYLVGVRNTGTSTTTLSKNTSTTTTTTVSSLTLDPTKTYRLFVQASNLQNLEQALPTQFNNAYNFVDFTLP